MNAWFELVWAALDTRVRTKCTPDELARRAGLEWRDWMEEHVWDATMWILSEYDKHLLCGLLPATWDLQKRIPGIAWWGPPGSDGWATPGHSDEDLTRMGEIALQVAFTWATMWKILKWERVYPYPTREQAEQFLEVHQPRQLELFR